MKDLTIVVPAYNEEKRIKKALNSIKTFFSDSKVIVVSNGSRDHTVDILKDWCKSNKNFSYLEFEEKLGKGGAIIKGFQKADSKFIGLLDADDSFDLAKVKKMVKELKDYDCVIASKWKGRNIFQIDEPFTRKVLSRVWNKLVKYHLGIDYRDTQAGAKFLRRDALDINNFVCGDFSFDAELLYRLKGKKVLEYYIPSKHVDGSTFTYKQGISMLKNIMRLK